MTYKHFIQQLQAQTTALSYEKGLTIAILLSRKLFPDYETFSTTHQWGDPAILQEALQYCEAAQAGIVNKNTIDSLVEHLYHVTPDMDDFGDYDGSCALNAAAALLHALQYVSGKDPKDIFAISTLYADTIDAKLHEMDIDDEKAIENHPLMQEAWQLVLQLSQ
jgi:uncharacterized protein YjaG (DUF416 family)